MDFLKASRHTKTQKFMEYNLEINMLPVITKPTRITDTSATLIDNILISGKLQQAYHSGIIISDMSDHLPTVIKLLSAKQDMKKQQILTYRIITDEKIKLINEELQGYIWEEILEKRGTDDSFNILHETLILSMDKHMPLKTKKLTKKDINKEPWITKGVENCIKKQKQLYKKSIGKRATSEDHKKYKEYKSMLQKIKRKAKMDHYQDKCLRYKNETRKLWDVINTITGKKRNRDSMVESLKVGSILTHDAKQIIDTFCSFFANVGKEYANLIPKGNNNIGYYLNKIPQNQQTMYTTTTSRYEVERIIGTLKNKNSSGFDEVSNKILKGITIGISTPLSILINKSLSEGIFPTEMKKADTIPLYKHKDKHDKDNYRPISYS